jgi:uncharacterized phiE125 gp8 family phage protein
MALVVVTPPTAGQGLISLADAKSQCNIDYEDDDALLGGLILAATKAVEANVQRRYLPQTINWIRHDWWHHMKLPIAPGGDSSQIVINHVGYTDINGCPQVLDPCLYWSRPDGDTLAVVRRWFAVWPLLGDGAARVTINFSITPDSVISDAAVHACKLLVSHWYQNRDAVVGVDNRDSSTPLPLGVESLLTFERWS